MGKFVKRNPIKKEEKAIETVDLKELNKKRFSAEVEEVKQKPKEIKKQKLTRNVKGFKIYKEIATDIDRLILDKKSENFGTSKEKDWDGSKWIMFCHKMALELELDKIYEPLDEFDASLNISKLEIKKHLQNYK